MCGMGKKSLGAKSNCRRMLQIALYTFFCALVLQESTDVQNFYLPKLNIGFPIVSFLPKIIFGNRITNWEF